MRNLLLTIGAIATWVLYWHIGLLAILIYIWAAAMTSTANTAKTRALAAQHAALVSSVATTNQNLTATNTNLATTTTTANSAQTAVTALQGGNTGFANTLGYGPTSTASIGITSGPSDTGFFNTGSSSGHTHSLPNFPQADHTHDFGGHTHDFGGHAHPVT